MDYVCLSRIAPFDNVLQDDQSGWLLAFVDIKTRVPSQYWPLILKRNFRFDVKKTSHQPDGPVTLYLPGVGEDEERGEANNQVKPRGLCKSPPHTYFIGNFKLAYRFSLKASQLFLKKQLYKIKLIWY